MRTWKLKRSLLLLLPACLFLSLMLWWSGTYMRFRQKHPMPAPQPAQLHTSEVDRFRADNVILVTFDALRADHVSAYGYPLQTTPNLDALASRGFVFRNATALSTWTFASLSSFVTGTLPRTHGFHNPRMALQEGPRPFRAFSAAGIHTCAFVPVLPLELGRDLAESHARPGETATTLTTAAIQWLQRHRDERFFLWLHYFEPHSPYLPPAGITAVPKSIGIKGRAAAPTCPAADTVDPARIVGKYLVEGHRETAYYRERYDRYIRYADKELGRLLEYIRAQPWAPRSTIVFSADHGESFGEHGLFQHGSLCYEEQMRVPLILSPGGGLPERRDIDEAASLLDLMPTLCELLNISCPDGLEGRSLEPLMQGKKRPRPVQYAETIMMPDAAPLACVRAGRYKVVYNGDWRRPEYPDWDRPYGYFDLEADPCELNPRPIGLWTRLTRPSISYLYNQLEHEQSRPLFRATTQKDQATIEKLRALGYAQ